MKILSAAQMKEADQATIKNEPISSLDLMERSSKKAFHWIQNFLGQKLINTEFYIFCGIGNNGGDGLVLARLLSDFAFQINVCVVAFSKKRSKDFEANFERIQAISNISISEIREEKQLEEMASISSSDWIIDAIFGYGLNRKPEDIAAKTIQFINQKSNQNVISIDIPSGLFADNNQDFDENLTIKATHTLTFQTPKLSFFFDDYNEFVGNFEVLNIGLDTDFIQNLSVQDFWLTPQKIKQIHQPRQRIGHKGTFGHALLLVGSYGKIGAAILAAKAALQAGLGLLTLRVPACGVLPIQTALPEAMILPDENDKLLTSISDDFLESLRSYKTLGIGCGTGTEAETQKLLFQVISYAKYPVVLDADALNILSQNREENNDWLELIPKNSILTPHPKEFERLFGKTSSAEERHQLLRNLAKKHQLYILLKGSFSALALPNGEVYHSSFGDIGMATGGSGDTLTGILTSLLAQGYNSEESLLLGVFLHGKAGELAAQKKSSEAMLPSDLIEELGTVFKSLNA